MRRTSIYMKSGHSRRLRKAELPGSNPGRSIIVKANKKEIYKKINIQDNHNPPLLLKVEFPWDSLLDDHKARIRVLVGLPISWSYYFS